MRLILVFLICLFCFTLLWGSSLNEPDKKFVHFITTECISEMIISGGVDTSSEELYKTVWGGFADLVSLYKANQMDVYFDVQESIGEYCPTSVKVFNRAIKEVYQIERGGIK